MLLLLLLSRFSRVQLCATPETAAHQAPLTLGFSRQEHWSGLPFPSPMHESEKWKWSRSVMSDSERPHRLQPTRLFCPWDFLGKNIGVGCHCLLWYHHYLINICFLLLYSITKAWCQITKKKIQFSNKCGEQAQIRGVQCLTICGGLFKRFEARGSFKAL